MSLTRVLLSDSAVVSELVLIPVVQLTSFTPVVEHPDGTFKVFLEHFATLKCCKS